LAEQLERRRRRGLDPDTTVLALTQQARLVRRDAEALFYQLGPSRAFSQLEAADSLLARAESVRPNGVLASIERAELAVHLGHIATAAQQAFPDSTGLPLPATYWRRAMSIAGGLVQRAPDVPDGWLIRGEATDGLLGAEPDSSLLPRALQDFRQANRLDPNRPGAWLSQASVESRMGDWRAALFSIQRARQTDRLHVLGAYLEYKRFMAELTLERYDSASVACREGTEHYPSAPLLRVCAAELAGARSAVPGDAVRTLQLADSLARLEQVELPAIMPTHLRLLAAAILWRAGLADSGERVYTRVTAGWGENAVPEALADAAYARMVRGEADSALALVARAIRNEPAIAPYVMRATRFAPLRREPGFEAALQGIPPNEARGRNTGR